MTDETKKYRRRLQKKMKSIVCDCKSRKSAEARRNKFGTCFCDVYSLKYTLAIVMANSLYEFLSDANGRIIMEDIKKEEIEQIADVIMAFHDADSWDRISHDKDVKREFKKKEIEFKKAMKWLADNWGSLWI